MPVEFEGENVPHPITTDTVKGFWAKLDDTDVVRVHYCYQLGSTFMSVAKMEDAIIASMLMCDRVRVRSRLGEEAENWQLIIEKQTHLQGSTLGSLIKILENHDVGDEDLQYLKWIKSKRDYLIHRFFHKGGWPGDLNEAQLRFLCRRLQALELLFLRASHRIWDILERAGLITISRFSDGRLAMNKGFLESWKAGG